jgi:predicted Rossmann fold flavoprotein
LNYDVIIIGGGAAGLFCAQAAGRRGRRVLVVEHTARLGSKILISGGGRCNFTNLGATAATYVTSGSPHFVKSALARFTPRDFLALVERQGVAWRERDHGQLFCQLSSKQMLQMLEKECAAAGVEVRLDCRILGAGSSWMVERLPDGGSPAASQYRIATSAGAFTARSLVIATGGMSYPKLGATSFGCEIARQFGVELVPVRPGLVPLTWSAADREQFAGLSGIAFDCVASVRPEAPAFREAVLFTHRGLSGPAILQISSYWRPGQSVCLNLLPGHSAAGLLAAGRSGGRTVKAVLRPVLPERLVRVWCARHAPAKPIAQLSRAELEGVARNLQAWEITPAGDEGYATAEVTVGGVDTRELSSKTLECRKAPGLYFIGEVVDVTGWLGGYNFQWAWASGHAAGLAV